MSSEDRNVYLVGGGLHPFGRYPDKPIEEIGRVAIQQALDDSGVPFEDIEVAYCGHVYQGMGAGLRVMTSVVARRGSRSPRNKGWKLQPPTTVLLTRSLPNPQ